MTPQRLSPAELQEQREAFVAALTGAALAEIVDLVLWTEPGQDGRPVAHAASSEGRVRLHPGGRHEVVSGTDPVPDEDPLAFLPYAREVAHASPPRSTRNAYPYAAERVLSFFADPERSPDLAVVHAPRHFFPAEGGHAGEHGSLDAIQSRAPLVLSGRGVRRAGYVDDHARLVDVGPTLALLAGVPERDLRDADGRPLDGRVLRRHLTPAAGTPDGPVIGVLFDGAHCGDLLHLAETGGLPNVARLVEHGVALRGGAVAEFPSVTLTNHTSILTGVGPGRHGVMGNVYYDRGRAERIVPNDATTWHRSAEWLRPGVRTVFELVGDAHPGAVRPRTASIDEAIDRGADLSTMQRVRDAERSGSKGPAGAAGLDHLLPDARASAHLHDAGHLADRYYAWATRVDDLGLQQMLQLVDAGLPRLTWWACVVTDAGHHAGGPRSAIARDSLLDSDARLGAVLDRLDALDLTGRCSFVLTADHGFEAADPGCTGSWGPALDALAIPYRDEGPGLVYLTGGEGAPQQVLTRPTV